MIYADFTWNKDKLLRKYGGIFLKKDMSMGRLDRMLRKVKPKIVKATSKAKKGMQYVCDSCGMILVVESPCSCDCCDILCCGQDMKVLRSYPKVKE